MFKSATVRAALCALCLLPFVAQAQITIASTDVLSLLGKTQITRDDTLGSVTVNLGAAGGNQTWDYRTQVISGENFTTDYVLPQTTPYAAQFPQANFTQKVTFQDASAGTAYLYSTVTASTWRLLGLAGESQDTTFVLEQEDEIAPLPLQFNRAWTVTSADTFDFPPAVIINKSVSERTVDAWGTIRLPLGDVSCLRIRSNDTDISLTYFNGMLFLSDTSTSINYLWVTKEHGAVASVISQANETNPNFTEASSFSLLQSTGTAVDEPNVPNEVPNGFVLAQNYPNPFARSVAATTIRFALPQAAFAELAVFTLQGELVRVLTSQVLAPGSHTFRWDGRDESGRALASGTYVYRLKAGKTQMSRTLLLMEIAPRLGLQTALAKVSSLRKVTLRLLSFIEQQIQSRELRHELAVLLMVAPRLVRKKGQRDSRRGKLFLQQKFCVPLFRKILFGVQAPPHLHDSLRPCLHNSPYRAALPCAVQVQFALQQFKRGEI